MTTIQIHLNVAARNQAIAQVLRSTPLPGITPHPNDWIVVLYFYSAVRYINAYLLSVGHQATTHTKRKQLMTRDAHLVPIYTSYTQLETRSRLARYDLAPESITATDVVRSAQELARIELAVYATMAFPD